MKRNVHTVTMRMKSDMMQNGKLSSQPSAEFPRKELDYSLSHTLEDETPDKYLVDLNRVKACIIGIYEEGIK